MYLDADRLVRQGYSDTGCGDKDTFGQEFVYSWYRGKVWIRIPEADRQVQPHRGRNLMCLQHGSRGSLVVGIEEKG
jgi:hypothetical protein